MPLVPVKRSVIDCPPFVQRRLRSLTLTLVRLARICCLDLDTFFVSVERLLDPSLRNKPVITGGRKGGRGVVTSCSYEARALGVRSGISIRDATKLAPHAVFVEGHMSEYSDYSRRAREIVERYSPIVIAASIDEQYIDFHGCETLYRSPNDVDDDATIARVVRAMVRAIEDELGLPASAGVATSRSLAKVACGLAKPNGVLFVRAGDERATLAPLPVRKLPGVGPVSEQRLHELGITTLGELAAAADASLRPIFGAYTSSLRSDALGLGSNDLGRERPAFREHDPLGAVHGTISNERTFVETSAETTESMLCSLCERVCSRARSRGVRAGTVTLRLRYTDFNTIHTRANHHADQRRRRGASRRAPTLPTRAHTPAPHPIGRRRAVQAVTRASAVVAHEVR